MSESAKKKATYDDLYNVPENMTGEIINGELIVTPRPSSTVRVDTMTKMPIYAQHGISYFWLIDPLAKTLDAFRLKSGEWVVAGLFAEDAKVRAEPFTQE